MTNSDRLRQMSDEDIADLLCNAMDGIADKTKDKDFCCDICPVTKLCKRGRNGFLAWLEKEAEDT